MNGLSALAETINGFDLLLIIVIVALVIRIVSDHNDHIKTLGRYAELRNIEIGNLNTQFIFSRNRAERLDSAMRFLFDHLEQNFAFYSLFNELNEIDFFWRDIIQNTVLDEMTEYHKDWVKWRLDEAESDMDFEFIHNHKADCNICLSAPPF